MDEQLPQWERSENQLFCQKNCPEMQGAKRHAKAASRPPVLLTAKTFPFNTAHTIVRVA